MRLPSFRSSRSPRRPALLLATVLAVALVAGLGASPHRAAAAGPLALPAPSAPSVQSANVDSYVVKSDGTLWTWGANLYGELGVGNVLPQSIPQQVGTDSDWAQVAGDANVLALKTDGTLWSWGFGPSGQLGLGDYTGHDTPQRVGTRTDWAAIAVGGDVCAAITQSGDLFTWGSSSSGALGQGATQTALTPTQITDPADTWTAVACGADFLLAVDASGSLWACGANGSGQLGMGGADQVAHTRLQAVDGGGWTRVAAGSSTSYAIKTDHTLWGWGSNADGAGLGDGTTSDRLTPARVGSDSDWASVSAGAGFTCAEKLDGSLWAWGYNSYGEVGLSAVGPVLSPRRIGTLNSWVAASAGGQHLLALTDADTFGVCGTNFYGEAGVGYADYRTLPEQLGTVGGWAAVDTGLAHSAAIRSDGTLWTWGRNSWGELGTDDQIDGSVNAPAQVAGAWQAVSCGDNVQSGFTLGIKTDHTLWSWGSNFAGQLGLGDQNERYAPVQVGSKSDWAAVAASDGYGDINDPNHLIDFSLGLDEWGNLYAWGNNDDGQLGQGDSAVHAGLKLVPCPDAGAVWSAIAAGDDYAMAITSKGDLYGWGDNSSGQLGLGYTSAADSPVTTPTRVGTDSGWLAVSCGSGGWGSHTAAIQQDGGSPQGQGTLWTWGEDNTGQLGNDASSYTPFPTPTQVGSGTDWQQVACGGTMGDDFTMARKADGSVWEFGGNYRGQLGQGDYASQFLPTEVTAVKAGTGTTPPQAWTTMAAGYNGFAIMGDGTLWGWGDNGWGQLGLGDQLSFPSANVFSILDYVDTTAPDATATGGTLAGPLATAGGALGASAGWSNKAVTVTFKATDPDSGAASSGVSRVQYSVTHGISWKMAGSVKVSRNGVTDVDYRAVDRVGNASAINERVVRVDTLHPRPVAAHAAAARSGGIATLRISVVDIKSMPTCGLTVVFRNAAGKKVWTGRLGQKATNRSLSYRFRCRFARGSYRFYLYATNLAGNHQSKVASNRLTVR